MGKLAFVISTQVHEKIQLAAMMASIHATVGGEVLFFVSMNGVLAFQKGKELKDRIIPEGEFSKLMLSKNVPNFINILKQIKMLGDVKIYACSMAMDVLGWHMEDLEEGLFDDVIGLTSFLDMAEDAKIIFV
ncbi:MAG: DsrE/DsrF/DrsH-like family protein [Hydrogenobaculum sp.]|jgi:peroxiredoxin family protein